MLNKRILLGSLVAGAMLLPMTSNAGVVSGPCVNCHTMHQTDGDGNNRTGGPTLMGGASCAECHATGNGNDVGTGKYDNGTFAAPQVDDASNPNLAGFFTTSGTAPLQSTQQHNLPSADGIAGMAPENELPNTNAPGGTAGNQTCAGCHSESSGGHHGGSVYSYRMLFDKSVNGIMVADNLYGGRAGGGTGLPDTSRTTYDAGEMNGVCAGCHGDFHSAANQRDGANNWILHPTDMGIGEAYNQGVTYDYTANYASANEDIVPLGTVASSIMGGATRTDALMCITCHFSHGGPNHDLLRFAYDAAGSGTGAGNNRAGDNNNSNGCESCHSYALEASGQQGM